MQVAEGFYERVSAQLPACLLATSLGARAIPAEQIYNQNHYWEWDWVELGLRLRCW